MQEIIVCFESPVLCTESQKKTIGTSCLLCFTLLGKTKPPPLGVVVCCTAFGRKNKATRFAGGSLLIPLEKISLFMMWPEVAISSGWSSNSIAEFVLNRRGHLRCNTDADGTMRSSGSSSIGRIFFVLVRQFKYGQMLVDQLCLFYCSL